MRHSELLMYDWEQILRSPFCGMTMVIVCEKSRKEGPTRPTLTLRNDLSRAGASLATSVAALPGRREARQGWPWGVCR